MAKQSKHKIKELEKKAIAIEKELKLLQQQI